MRRRTAGCEESSDCVEHVADPDRRRRRVGPAVRNRDQHFADAKLFGKLGRASPEMDDRLAALLSENFNVQPADAFNESRAQHLHDRLFGGPAPCKGFVAVLPLLAVGDLVGRVDSIQKMLTVSLDHLSDAWNLDDVCAEANDHEPNAPTGDTA